MDGETDMATIKATGDIAGWEEAEMQHHLEARQDQSLFLDSPTEFERRIDRLVEHFRHGEYLFYTKRPSGVPNPRDVLWLLFQEAVETARLLPDRERRMVSHVATVMPAARASVYDVAAIADLERQDYEVQISRLRDGMQQYDHIKVREDASAAAADRMVDVMDLLRFVKAGRAGHDVSRHKRTFLAHAAGHGPEFCTRVWDRKRTEPMTRQSLHDIKMRVLGQVLAGIQRDFGLVKTGRGFRRLTLKEVDRLRRERKRAENARKREEAAQ